MDLTVEWLKAKEAPVSRRLFLPLPFCGEDVLFETNSREARPKRNRDEGVLEGNVIYRMTRL